MSVLTPHEAWLARRRSGIGGSDVSAIIGISPFKTALDVWAEKRGITTSASSQQMDFGRLLEPAILQAFAERSELQVRQVPQEFLPVAHRARPWQLASPDGGTVTSPSYPVEAKNVSQWQSREWGEEWTDEIPDHYQVQCQWYLSALESDICYVAALIGGCELRCYTVRRNEKLITKLIAACERFWFVNVVGGERPVVVARDGDTLAKIYAEPTKTLLDSTPETDEMAKRLAELDAQAELIAAQRAELETEFKALIGPDLGIQGAGWSAKWISAKGRKKFDVAAAIGVGAISQDVVDKFTIRGEPERRFLFKTKTGD